MPFGFISEQQKAAPRADAAQFLPFGFVFPRWTLQSEPKLERKYFWNQQTKGGKIPGCHPKHGAPAGSACVGMGHGGWDVIAWAEI